MKRLSIVLLLFNIVNPQFIVLPNLDLIVQYITVALDRTDLNTTCVKLLKNMLEDFKNNEEWAVRMLDANAKLQPGILEGNIMHAGHYDECLNIDALSEGIHIRGQYCSVLYSMCENGNCSFEENDLADEEEDLIQQIHYSWGICIPTVCSVQDIEDIWKGVRNETKVDVGVNLKLLDKYCDYDGKMGPYSASAIFAMTCFGLFGAIIILSTLYDIHTLNVKRGPRQQLLCAFSFYSNGLKLFSTRKSHGTIGCLNGMRVISMFWILMSHRFMYSSTLAFTNLIYIDEWQKDYKNAAILSAFMAVDTFFAVSGILVMYVLAGTFNKGHKFNIVTFVLHRYLRLTPSLAAVVLFYGTLLKYLGSGPFWVLVYDPVQKQCEENWWSTLLYIQNYVNPDDTCVGQSWYLAVDTQLYYLSPLLLFPILRWPKRTISFIVFLIMASTAWSFVVTWIHELSAVQFGQNAENFRYYYVPTHIRMTTWLTGFLTGYILYKYKNVPIKLNKLTVISLWTISLSILAATVLGLRDFMEYDYDVLKSSSYNAFGRIGWAVAICTITFLCASGYGGLIDNFLSCWFFTIMIRINYSMYLLHALIIIYFVGETRTPQFFANKYMYHHFWGDLAFTAIASILLTLAFESPILVLEKYVFGRISAKKKEINNTTDKTDIITIQRERNNKADTNC